MVAAVILPFELFLFSYAVLGPMHYLTEINWLKSKTYFSKTTKPAFILIGLISLIILIYLGNFISPNWFGFNISKYIKVSFAVIILTSFMFIILLEFFEDKLGVWISLAFSVLITLVLLKLHSSIHIFSFVFLPTLVHVYIFTGLFMLYGYTKQRNPMTLIALGLMILVPFLIYFIPNRFFQQISSPSAEIIYFSSGFAQLNAVLSKPFNTETVEILNLKIQSFIAFAYTYHYLNWFGKTNVIGWAKAIKKSSLMFIVFIWLFIISIYIYDYNLGLMLLFFISLAHVLLEFPLNVKSFRGVFNFLR